MRFGEADCGGRFADHSDRMTARTQMNSRERIEAALLGRPIDHVPFCPFLAYVWENFPKDVQELGQLAFHRRIGADPLWRGAPCPVKAVPPAAMRSDWVTEATRRTLEVTTPVGKLRQAWRLSESGQTWFLTEHPLRTAEDYKVQTWIETHTMMVPDPAPVATHRTGPGAEGLSLGMLIPRGKSAFQSLVEHLVGTEELAYALADFPEVVQELWQAMVDQDLAAVALAAESEYEWFITWEDSSTQNYSPGQYRTYIHSEIAAWCRMLSGGGKRYVQHACGHVHALVGQMLEQGVHSVESLSPPPTGNLSVRDARRIVGASMGIIGGIEPTHFLALQGAALDAYAEQVVADAAGGPFVLANSDSCPPGVTVEKFARIAQLALRLR